MLVIERGNPMKQKKNGSFGTVETFLQPLLRYFQIILTCSGAKKISKLVTPAIQANCVLNILPKNIFEICDWGRGCLENVHRKYTKYITLRNTIVTQYVV